MSSTDNKVDVAIIGAGIAGIAAAYYLGKNQNIHNVVIVDPLAPMSFTSAQSGENYRNWWPHKTMIDFTNRSIDLMEQVSDATQNVLAMNRRGYALATRQQDISALLAEIEAGYGSEAERNIRMHSSQDTNNYQPPVSDQWSGAPVGVDVLQNRELIGQTFPSFSKDIANVIHIRRGGDISGQQLGQYMLEQVRANGGKLLKGRVKGIAKPDDYLLDVDNGGQSVQIRAEKIINAAGPFAKHIAGLLDVDLPIENVLQQKIAFHDREAAIPRDMPFSIDIDGAELNWSDEERELLAEEESLSWLTRHIDGAIHCRPDGGDHGSWIKMGWAINEAPLDPEWEPELDPQFPEIVLRGAASLNPSLKTYYGGFPRNFLHYGGYYSMTPENWPLIGPMDQEGAFMIAALSGFGTMAACAAGELCASWVADQPLPEYAQNLSLQRYDDAPLMAQLLAADRGVL